MPDPKDPAPADEADAVLGDIKKPDPSKNPAKEIEERGAPAGSDFA